MIAETPKPPYYVVIFTSLRVDGDDSYAEVADRMLELARQQDGFLGVESARSSVGVTISYWKNLSVIQQWKNHPEHILAQKGGQELWYQSYKVRIAKVERDYEFSKPI